MLFHWFLLHFSEEKFVGTDLLLWNTQWLFLLTLLQQSVWDGYLGALYVSTYWLQHIL